MVQCSICGRHGHNARTCKHKGRSSSQAGRSADSRHSLGRTGRGTGCHGRAKNPEEKARRKPSTTARWVDRKPSEPLPKLSPTPYTMQMDIGNDASNLCFGMVADPLRSMRPSWHNRRDWLWGALDREDGRKLDISLCMECSTYRYDTGEPSIAIRDPRDRPREPIACLGGYGRLRRKTLGPWVKG